MKKLSQSAKLNIENVERSLIQDLSEQQASHLAGGIQRLQEEFQAELSVLRGLPDS
jgi:hypothetical protein